MIASFLILGAFIVLTPGLSPSISLPDDSFIKAAKEKTADYHQKQAFERVYLHTDKTLYEPGEMIWFSGYLQALGQKTSRLSNVVHVAIKDSKGNIVSNLVYPVMQGKIKGNFLIEADKPGGLYEIIAYTQWIKNQGEAHYFRKKIQVQKVIKPRLLLKLDFKRESYGANDWVEATLKARDTKDQPIAGEEVGFQASLSGKLYKKEVALTNRKGEALIRFQLPGKLKNNDGLLNVVVTHKGVSESIARSIPLVLNKITLDFYPEGGNWVAGTEGKMAFKALNEFYKPADIEGVVLDEKGAEIQSLKSFHQGLGAFKMTPKAGEKYQIKITKPAGIDKLYALPKAEQNQVALSIKSRDTQQLVVQFFTPKTDTFYLAAQSGGKMHYMQKVLARRGVSQQSISIKQFPIGITKVTLFDQKQQQRCERLVFINPHKKLKIQVKMPRKSYQPREKVEAEILTTNEAGHPVSANISVAVVDDKIHTLADDKQDNLLSYMLMSEELIGKVYEPNFYFKEDEPKAKAALDYVMLTHGWRRYEWNKVWENKATNFTFQKEFFEEISGRVYGTKSRRDQKSKGRPIKAKVTLFELGGKKRALQIKTDAEGRFTFRNIDPFIDVQLIAERLSFSRKGCVIEIDQKNSRKNSKALVNALSGRVAGVQLAVNNGVISRRQKQVNERKAIIPNGSSIPNNDFSLNNSTASLNEVVVVSYGVVQRNRATTGMVATKKRNSLAGQGYLYVRGASSVSTGIQPLLVIDGVPMTNQSFTSNFSPDDLRSVQVLRGNQAMALYGVRAQNGVILIETKNQVEKTQFAKSWKPIKRTRFAQYYVQPYSFTPAKVFRAREYKLHEQNPKDRTDFESTIYWNPEVITNKNGKAKITFWNNDALTTFRVIAEGVSQKGRLGRIEQTYFAKLPFELTAKIPPYFSVGDSLKLPVYLANNTDKTIEGNLWIKAPGAFVLQEENRNVSISPQTNQTIYVSASVTRTLLDLESNIIQVAFDNQQYHESFQKAIEVIGQGFPVEKSFAGNEVNNQFPFNPEHIVKGTLKAELVAYPNIFKDLTEGIKSIIRRPYGCFEQVSSSTYPNILALQFIQKTGSGDKQFAKKAKEYIKDGYNKLAAYETSEHGFEWYGHTPPHEGLTAFGLLEFLEMKKVYKGVSESMLARTKKWLLSRRNGRGGFKQKRGKYEFAAASKEVNNAYIVYALTQAGVKGLTKEYQHVLAEALNSKDAYRLALTALSSISLGKTEDTQALLKTLRGQIDQYGYGKLPVDHTLVYAYGKSAQIETAALIAMAEMRLPKPDLGRVHKLVNYLIENRRRGYFGSTQGTILALQALTTYAHLQTLQVNKGTLAVYQGSKQIGAISFSKDQLDEARLAGLEQYLQKNGGDITVRFGSKKQVIPFNLNIRYQTYKPNTSTQCNIDLQTRLSTQAVNLNETIRLTTIIRNKQAKGQPSTIALVGIPSGLSPQPWQLKELVEKKKIAYYEIYGSYLVFYFRELGPSMVKTIHLDLKADVPGIYRAPASSAYLYYTSEFKDWEAGTEVLIKSPVVN